MPTPGPPPIGRHLRTTVEVGGALTNPQGRGPRAAGDDEPWTTCGERRERMTARRFHGDAAARREGRRSPEWHGGTGSADPERVSARGEGPHGFRCVSAFGHGAPLPGSGLDLRQGGLSGQVRAGRAVTEHPVSREP
ncbi:hypothetical protein Afil01_22490 [Actinorhabdospora filicis]|uniref:Uncharacterized protein n=1 Tax=Actinorhabdospora filicis TaxID=1785913 RepID=A0A9W6SK59_9ACTN|nr:hypothetical protein Afil01_22490 [Actinorhabdospora filicis]